MDRHMKKNLLNMMLVAGLVVLAAACAKQPGVSGNVVTIKATVEGSGTKAMIAESDAKFSWTAGDQISVFTSTGGYQDSDALAAGGSATAAFTFASLDDADRSGFAVYPASIKDAAYPTSDDFRVGLPTEYDIDLDDPAYAESVPVPMAAKNAPGEDLSFKHLCALIRLTLLNVPAGTNSILVTCDQTIAGNFSVLGATSDPFQPYLTYDQGTADAVTFNLSAPLAAETDIVLNLPVPTGDYAADHFYAQALDDSDVSIRNYTFSGPSVMLPRAKGKKMAVTAFPFSVSAEKKVAFAPGNLQAKTTDGGANWTWGFASDQLSYMGSSANGNLCINGYGTTSELSCTVDLFGWKTGDKNNCDGINSYTDASLFSGDFVDWGTLSIGDYAANTWSTLSKNEWQYVLMTREASTLNGKENARFLKANIGTLVNGIILFPDNYVHPAGVALPPAENISAPAQGYYACSLDDWYKMAAAGCVFLPAAGWRYTSAGKVLVEEANSVGTYWSATKTTDVQKALAIKFTDSSLSYMATPYRRDGYAVRLVREVQ